MVDNNHSSGKEGEEQKLEDILKSIRGMIDNQNYTDKNFTKKQEFIEDNEDDILELTDVFTIREEGFEADRINDNEESLLAKATKDKSTIIIDDFIKTISDNESLQNQKPLKQLTQEFMQPLLKEWLDNNLPEIIQKVVATEIRKLIPKK